MQAEQGHVFVVAASHLIFRLRQPSQALITIFSFSNQLQVDSLRRVKSTFQPLVAVVLINEHIVYTDMLVPAPEHCMHDRLE